MANNPLKYVDQTGLKNWNPNQSNGQSLWPLAAALGVCAGAPPLCAEAAGVALGYFTYMCAEHPTECAQVLVCLVNPSDPLCKDSYPPLINPPVPQAEPPSASCSPSSPSSAPSPSPTPPPSPQTLPPSQASTPLLGRRRLLLFHLSQCPLRADCSRGGCDKSEGVVKQNLPEVRVATIVSVWQLWVHLKPIWNGAECPPLSPAFGDGGGLRRSGALIVPNPQQSGPASTTLFPGGLQPEATQTRICAFRTILRQRSAQKMKRQTGCLQ